MTGPRRRLLASAGAVTVALVAGLAATAVPAPAAPAADADPAPALSLRRTAASVELPKYSRRVYLDLGAYLVAGDAPFEVRTTRPAIAPYRHPVTTTIVRPDALGGDIVLPEGMVKNFGGLPRFTHVRLVDRNEMVVQRISLPLCPSETGVRVRPDAPDTSPYPYGCYRRNPFTLGSVQGIESGWGVSVTDPYGRGVELPLGRYTATVSIDKAYRSLLDIPRSAATATIEVRVVNGDDGCEGMCRSSGDTGAPASAGATGVPSQPAASEPTGPGVAAPPADALPDLRSVPAWGMRIVKGHFLAFGATVWNRGPSPLVVDGFRREGEDVMDAYQYFYDAQGDPHGFAPTGTMEWDERDGHHHWHFRDFARYRLLDADKQAVVRSKKEAFCLANTDAIDYTVPGANWRPENTDLHTACGSYGALGVREVLDAGSGDTYGQYRPGQSFNLSGLEPGTYYIEVTGNPTGNLAETDTTNNTALRRVRIGGAADADRRTVRVFDVGLVHTR